MGRERVDGVSIKLDNDEDYGRFSLIAHASSICEPHGYDAELRESTWRVFREMDNRRSASNQMTGS